MDHQTEQKEAPVRTPPAQSPNIIFKRTEKPVELWVGLILGAAGLGFWIVEKTTPTVIFALLAMFVMLAHPIWSFWWIEQSKIRRVLGLVILSISLGVFGYNNMPGPKTLTDAQVCAKAISFAQRVRTFDRERSYGRNEMEKETRKMIAEAKTQKQQERIAKERSELWSRQFSDYQYDYETKLQPEAWALRHQLLMRLPQITVSTVINDDATFNNIGAGGLPAVANRIESLGRALCPLDEPVESVEKK